MTLAYIGLGTNLGDLEDNLAKARELIAALPDSRITKVSSIYKTTPWGKSDQPDFLNQVLALETGLQPLELLYSLLDIEAAMGRQRLERWGPRIIDLDMLLFGDQIINETNLIIPHPFLPERVFVIIPLLEMEPDLKMPEGRALSELFDSFDKLTSIGCVLYSSMLK